MQFCFRRHLNLNQPSAPMKKTMLVFVFWQISMVVFAQNNSIRNFILTYRDPKTEIISKGRRLIFDKLLQNDTSKVREVVDYLENEEDENYLALYPQEKWMLYYWTGQYEKVLENLPSSQRHYYGRFFFRGFYPDADPVLHKLVEVVKGSKDEIVRHIKASALSDTDKDFLALNLDYQLSGLSYRSNNNPVAGTEAFLKVHPNSAYETYVRRNIKQEVVRSKWGLGFEFFSGYGILTNDLKTHFKNTVPVGVGFDVAYKNFTLYLRDFIGFSRTKDSLHFPAGIWKKGAQARIYLPEASLSYPLLESRRFKLSPFAGIASCSFAPTENDRNKNLVNDDVELKFTTAYTFGLNVDWKLGKSYSGLVAANEDAYWFLRIRYAFNSPQFKNKYTGFNGNLHAVTIGIGGFGRPVKRYY